MKNVNGLVTRTFGGVVKNQIVRVMEIRNGIAYVCAESGEATHENTHSIPSDALIPAERGESFDYAI